MLDDDGDEEETPAPPGCAVAGCPYAGEVPCQGEDDDGEPCGLHLCGDHLRERGLCPGCADQRRKDDADAYGDVLYDRWKDDQDERS